jgi:hypothetical protein
LIEDPNHPAFAQLEPIERFLEDTVKQRLATEVRPREQEKRENELKDRPLLEQALKSRIYFRRSEFSEPSEIVEVKGSPQTIAGAIAGARFVPAPKESGAPPDLQIRMDDPSGKMMAVVFDEQRAVDVPGVVDVYRGSVLNFTSNADVIHPIMLTFKKLTDVRFRTDRVVADIRGGIELPEAKQPTPSIQQQQYAMDAGMGMGMEGMPTMPPARPDPLYSFGEYVVLDEKGRLKVYSEFDDWQNFKRMAMPPQPETAGMYGMPGDAGMPGLEGAMPGDDGGGRRRR